MIYDSKQLYICMYNRFCYIPLFYLTFLGLISMLRVPCLMFPLNILCQKSFCSNFWQTDFHPLKDRHVFILICWCFGIILKVSFAQYFRENSIFYTFSNRNFREYQKLSSHLHEDKIWIHRTYLIPLWEFFSNFCIELYNFLLLIMWYKLRWRGLCF